MVVLSRRRVFLLAVVAFLLIPAAAFAGSLFTDVSDTNTHFDGIKFMKDTGVTAGCGDGTVFCPKENVLREQMATFMYRLSGNDPAVAPSVNADKLDGVDSSGFLGSSAKAVDADLLDGIDSSGFLQSGTIVTTTGGAAWLAHNSAPTTITRWVSGTEFSSDGVVVMALAAPTTVGTLVYGLHEFELCYSVSGGGFVNVVEAFRTNESSTSGASLLFDGTDQTTTGCTIYSVDRAAGAGVGIAVTLGGGGTVRLEGVKATWTNTANLASVPVDNGSGLNNG